MKQYYLVVALTPKMRFSEDDTGKIKHFPSRSESVDKHCYFSSGSATDCVICFVRTLRRRHVLSPHHSVCVSVFCHSTSALGIYLTLDFFFFYWFIFLALCHSKGHLSLSLSLACLSVILQLLSEEHI